MDANALLMQTYNNTPDHGSSVGSFYRYVTPSVTVEMLYGEKEPAGKTLFELGYDSDAKTISVVWKQRTLSKNWDISKIFVKMSANVLIEASINHNKKKIFKEMM